MKYIVLQNGMSGGYSFKRGEIIDLPEDAAAKVSPDYLEAIGKPVEKPVQAVEVKPVDVAPADKQIKKQRRKL